MAPAQDLSRHQFLLHDEALEAPSESIRWLRKGNDLIRKKTDNLGSKHVNGAVD